MTSNSKRLNIDNDYSFEYITRNISVSEEVKSRLAYTIGISDKNLNYHTFDKIIITEKNKDF